jgi:hypothetical protein
LEIKNFGRKKSQKAQNSLPQMNTDKHGLVMMRTTREDARPTSLHLSSPSLAE